MKLGPQRNYHKGRAAIRHYANQPFSVIIKHHRRLIVYSTSLVPHCHWSRPSKQVEITALNQQHSQHQTSRAFSLLIKPSNEWQNGGFKMENSDIHKYKCYMLVHNNAVE